MEDTGNTAAPSTPQATPPNRSGGAKRHGRGAGRFGSYGGRFVPETLMAALQELEAAYESAQARSRNSSKEYHRLLEDLPGVRRRCSWQSV